MKKYFDAFPFLTVTQAMWILRISLAMLFMAHAGMRFTQPDYFNGFGKFLSLRGVPLGVAVAWSVTLIELIGGCLLIFNRFSKWVALCYFSISAGGIVIIHARLGWFVGEFGEGGVEYSLALCAACIIVAAADRSAQKNPEISADEALQSLPIYAPVQGFPQS